MNKLDGHCVIPKPLLATVCAMLNPLNQAQDKAAKKAVRLLNQDLTGWVAAPMEPTDAMELSTLPSRDTNGYTLPQSYSEAYRAMLAASPPLPGGV
jgi:hypothetical protein